MGELFPPVRRAFCQNGTFGAIGTYSQEGPVCRANSFRERRLGCVTRLGCLAVVGIVAVGAGAWWLNGGSLPTPWSDDERGSSASLPEETLRWSSLSDASAVWHAAIDQAAAEALTSYSSTRDCAR